MSLLLGVIDDKVNVGVYVVLVLMVYTVGGGVCRSDGMMACRPDHSSTHH